MTKIISHPGKPLILHLQEVARFCATTIESKSFELEIEKEILRNLGFIQGAVHDIGKATRNFQTYIKSGGETIIRPKHHALISAYLAREIARHYLSDLELPDFDKILLPYFIFTSVKRHHGNVLNFNDELETVRSKEEDLKILVDNFYEEEVQLILDELLAEIGLQYNWKDFKSYMRNLDEIFDEFSDFSIETLKEEFVKIPDLKKAEYFYLHHLFFSTLLYADKSDVKLGKEKQKRTSGFNFDAIEKFRSQQGWDKVSEEEINNLKNQAYSEGLENLNKVFRPSQYLYSITLPTGLGKTITSLAIAMRLKKLLEHQNPRIIITIPFTSIIDQNYGVFDEIFKNPSSDLLLKHHHLAEPQYKSEEEDEVKSTEVSQFLIETWQSEIVVTTFVQLLEGIFTNHKGKLLKLPNLMNSIIILDEIQQIQYELWELIRAAFQVLGEKYNCYFILMSATQPLIFKPEKEIVEIIPNHKQYFNFFNRTKLVNKTNEVILLEDFSETVIQHHTNHPKDSILVILNTKKVTLNCFNTIKEQISSGSANLYFLTTLITPYERKTIIERIKNPPNNLPNIIVSTQLIEAGVDISVHTVFRAFAPLDSIIQAAGRANRYWENPEISTVYLYRIDELEKASNMLYGKDLMMKTQNVLRDIESVDENRYLSLIEAYFREVKKQSDNIVSEELEHLQKLNFEDLGKFSFIPYRKTESVFAQLNEQAQQLWEQYKSIYQNTEWSIFEKREQFALIKADFYDYVVNVPVKWGEEEIAFDGAKELHFYVSKLEYPSSCYKYSADDFRENVGYLVSGGGYL
ncbi:MAG: CRISPR-associated helicase Cas3' [Bacteroidota bacterium]